ncbi:hypothetical protein BCT56_24765 [Vibrio lentus]|uniref:Uncharacterized protein n=2 Tax=Vibrio lentus TaxID=136468 RepID=A0AB36XHH6_9VIBR|nr:hypothetical protein BCU51_10810 [Vibrio lentus]PMK35341.1 hypothetical protein BCU02_15150 [Vibrio lentus]PMK42827.1 hypothetical protein BCT99_25595 [Vibrio lentus]PML28405.1 hypothetical protein BCT79_25895 [Vibrio lentus]PMM41169.1 hypothetical protein BCT56_24765 [Vibrio lentus]
MNHHVFAFVQGKVIPTSIEPVSDLVLKGKEQWRDAASCHSKRCAIKIDTRGGHESSKGMALTGSRILSERVNRTDSVTVLNDQDNLFCLVFFVSEYGQGAPRVMR